MRKIVPFAITLLFLTIYGCEPFLEFNPVNPKIIVPDVIEPDPSDNDPQQTGVACGYLNRSISSVDLLDNIDIPNDLPLYYDLSDSIPPVRSQGSQGSCVSWATTYYLKSYQEKIEHGYDYESYEDVMSPAYVYNQTKANPNCDSGSNIANALEILKTQGVLSWQAFPYSDSQCSNLPTEEEKQMADTNQIEDYFIVGIPDTNTDPNYTLINLIKTLVSQDNPIVISLDISNIDFTYLDTIDNDFVARSYSENPIDACGHAVLIVGYSDELNAFKFVNSWGTTWGNEGYAWLDYNFFLPDTEPDYQFGLGTAFIAFDKE
ncbi:MAG: C1 family peptidase [Flavobacteriaceae bacterium]